MLKSDSLGSPEQLAQNKRIVLVVMTIKAIFIF
jgi:hypothetical protein